MPVVRDPADLPARHGTGWAQHVWASPQLLGVPVPMQAWRWVLDPAAASPAIGLGAPEGLLYLVSTRDGRDRLDLVTESVPVGARRIRADRIIYHPGDTAAAHFHAGCHHVFCVLAGQLLCTDRQVVRISAGMSALVGPGEVHWFVNDTEAGFSFVEFWAPPPAGTVWTVAGDRCPWAPAS
jgi:quercetin dioxygenase-like cupin family protein